MPESFIRPVTVPATVLLLGLLALLALPDMGVAQECKKVERVASPCDVAEPARASSAPLPTLSAADRSGSVSIDGALDDEAWRSVTPTAGFIQGEPVEGVPAEQPTEVRVMVDEDALYVAARMHEPDPSAIGTQLVRRDEQGSFDWFSVSLDPNLDRRTGYTFRVSAAGVQLDEYHYNDDQTDRSWDAVWESSVQVDSLGWSAEIRIPLSQIRYESGSEPQTWGVNFTRRRIASNETSYFALKSRLREGTVSQFGRIRDVRLPEPSRRIELSPYVLSSIHTADADPADPFFDGAAFQARTGLDAAIGLGSAFTLNATVNPDFGQVEADPAVINLSAFETFFDERRPFFVEDAQMFDFSLSGRQNNLFYSRRIGRSPHGDAPDDADFQNIPDAATILGAAKVTGRTQSGLSMGALAAVTEAETGRAFFEDDGEFQDFLVEPRSQYGVVRLQQDFNDGGSQVAGVVTGMNRELPGGGGFDFLPERAYSAGLRFEHQWNDRDWRLSGFAAGSHVRGDSTAMIRVQRASNHYFQRPDAPRLSVDSAATSLSGMEWRLELARQNGEHWTGGVWLGEVTKGFEINDLGFSNNAEKLDAGFRVGYREIEPGEIFRNYSVNMFSFHNFSHEALDEAGSWESWRNAQTSGNLNLHGRGEFLNFWNADLRLGLGPDTYSRSATRGGPVMMEPGNWSVNGGFRSDGRKAVSFSGGFQFQEGFRDSGGERTLRAGVSIRPSSRLEVEVQPRFSVSSTGAQYVTTFDEDDLGESLLWAPTYGNRYLFGELDRKTLSVETRANWTFSPTLSFQLFAQPLISSGDYLRYRQLDEAGGYDFVDFEEGTYREVDGLAFCAGGGICTETGGDGEATQHLDLDGDGFADTSFGDRDFNVRSLVGNAVLRWEYRPGSAIFLVWQRRQAGRTVLGDFDLGRDFGALFGAPADNRFILKVDYWLGL